MSVPQETIVLDHNEQLAIRREKLAQLREQGQAFPNDFRPQQVIATLFKDYESLTTEALHDKPIPVAVAGRMMTRRVMGKASFAHLQDRSGAKIQVYLRGEELTESVYESFKTWDLGDIIGIEGVLFKTKTGELTIKAMSARLLTKALRPLPDKFHGLADQEVKYRQRYLDLISNPDARRVFEIRSRLIAAIRQFLLARDYLEVETPMMQSIPGGAVARPFVTHHNALDMDLYLRIAPELYLKRLVVGGFERVFEINRNFRNEGISTRHNPEFTMLEFYQAYANYHDLIDLTEAMLRQITQEVLGTQQVKFQDHEIDFSKPFPRMTIKQSISHFNPEITQAELENIDKARAVAKRLEIAVPAHHGLGRIHYDIFEKVVERKLFQPTFITEFPTEVSPLARKNDKDPTITDRFEFFAGGQEIANGFSELNDPEDQAERFRAQVEEREAGDLEAMYFDNDYITALEHGMPPTAGEGIGIDRLTMILTNSPSIRDVILFPLLRHQQEK